MTARSTKRRSSRRLVLIGAGRGHLHLLRALAKPLVRGLEIVLLTPEREHFSATMHSALLRGALTPAEARIDVVALAERAGARLLTTAPNHIAMDEHVVLAGAERIPFDVCSLDVDGEPDGANLPGVRSHALPLRPTSVLPLVRERIEACIAGASGRVNCAIVGGGTRGVETAFVLQGLLSHATHGGVVTIVDETPAILADAAPCRDLARDALERAGVCFVLGTPVVEVRADRVLLGNGGELPATLVLWATSGSAPDLIVSSGLPHDSRGRLVVDDGLRAIDGSQVWAAGDCAARAADASNVEYSNAADWRMLERSVRAALGAPPSPAPRRRGRELCLLDTADGRALAHWRGVRGRSSVAGWLKRRLDRRLVASFARP
jgi:NADH dehydrogenase